MEKRVIKKFPQAPADSATPYRRRDYSKETKDVVKSRAMLYVNICKAIFIGDVSVGKTTLVNRFCYDSFQDAYKATIGVDFEIQRFQILDVPFNLQIWDTAGQERFRCISQAYYRNANVIMVVFDMTKEESLNSAPKWIEDAVRVNHLRPFVFLVGTKRDLLSSYELKKMETKAMNIAENVHAEYWCVSAKTGSGIVELFQRMVALSFDQAIIQSVREFEQSKRNSSILISLDRPANHIKTEMKKSRCQGCRS